MPRTYSFDHFTATKPAISVGKRASTQERKPLKSELHSHAGAVHYGHAHSRTEELYKQHREEHERQEAMRVPEDMPPESLEAESMRGSREPVEEGAADSPQGLGLKDMAQGVVGSVMQAAKETLRGRPLVGARRLAGDAVTGALRVAREVSARKAQDKKGPGKGH